MSFSAIRSCRSSTLCTDQESRQSHTACPEEEGSFRSVDGRPARSSCEDRWCVTSQTQQFVSFYRPESRTDDQLPAFDGRQLRSHESNTTALAALMPSLASALLRGAVWCCTSHPGTCRLPCRKRDIKSHRTCCIWIWRHGQAWLEAVPDPMFPATQSGNVAPGGSSTDFPARSLAWRRPVIGQLASSNVPTADAVNLSRRTCTIRVDRSPFPSPLCLGGPPSLDPSGRRPFGLANVDRCDIC